MCGIAGVVGTGGESLPRMLRAIAHRGPDDAGELVVADGGVHLGHRRLSIIDPSPAGHQPMYGAGGRLAVVYNGEIYNYAELRQEMEALGDRFRTGSDTEVLLAAYARWGRGALRRLRGMFAFALWDREGGELVLARDRFGIKPLFYAELPGGGVAFASEVGALLAGGLVSRTLDRQAVWDYLSHGAVAQPRTILAGARALPAGSLLVLRPGAPLPEPERWWDLEQETAGLRGTLATISYEEAVEGVRERLAVATRYHLVADVPVGAFLSGGIDSSAVVGLMSAAVASPIRTFAVGFETASGVGGELAWARIAAERFATRHTEVVVTAADAADAFDDLVRGWDQPSLDGANTWFVARAARAAVPVALSGLGGDELFAGYPHFRRYRRAARVAPGGLAPLRMAAPLTTVLPPRARIEFAALAGTPATRLASLRRLMGHAEAAASLSSAFLRGFVPVDPAERAAGLLRGGLDPVAQVTYAEVEGYLKNTLLRDADAMSMAHALEVRPPLLDHPLAEFVFALPERLKLRPHAPKSLLVDAVGELLPREIVHRPKMGFELPLNRWLGTTLRERAREILEGEAARSLLADSARARGLADLADLGERPGGPPRLWSWVVLLACVERHRLVLEP